MNTLQLERRLRRLEEKVSIKTEGKSSAPSVIRFPGGSLKIDKTGNWMGSNGPMPEGVNGYFGYINLSKLDSEQIFSKIDKEFYLGMVMFYYDEDNQSPYTVDINLYFGEEDEQVCRTKQETFDSFEDAKYYITSEVRNPYSLSEPISNKRIWQYLYH